MCGGGVIDPHLQYFSAYRNLKIKLVVKTMHRKLFPDCSLSEITYTQTHILIICTNAKLEMCTCIFKVLI